MNVPTKAQIKQAIQAMKIDKPIQKITRRGQTLTFYLYGGELRKYRLPTDSGQSGGR